MPTCDSLQPGHEKPKITWQECGAMSSSIGRIVNMRCSVLTRLPSSNAESVNMADRPSSPAGPLQPAVALAIDCAEAAKRIEVFLRETLRKLNRRGCVIGVSGGVDSAVCVHLAVRALGPNRVIALLMPERESSGESAARARRLCER